MKYQDEFRKEYFEKLKKEGYELNGQIFVQIEKDIYIEWLETKLKNTLSNSNYAKCKSICCPFYDEKMEFNCCANESLCEKCMNSQQFASKIDYAKCPKCGSIKREQYTKSEDRCLDCGYIYPYYI